MWTFPLPPTTSATLPGWCAPMKARPSCWTKTPCLWCSANPSALWARLCRGTSPSSWRPGSWPRCLPQGAAPCSNPPTTLRFQCLNWRGSLQTCCPRACSTSLPGAAPAPASSCLSILASASWPSPGLQKLAVRWALQRPNALFPPPLSWAANRPTSTFPIASGIWPWMACKWASCSTRGRYAAPDRAFLCMRTFTTSSWQKPWNASTASRLACRGIPQPRWVRRFTNHTSRPFNSALNRPRRKAPPCFAAASALQMASLPRAASCVLPCSATSPTTCAWRRTKSSAPWQSSSNSGRKTKLWPWPTTALTAWAARSGRATSTGPCA